MHAPSAPHRTPLRRVSQGSLRALSRSTAFPDAPYGLGFIEPAMAELVDEVEALQANIEGLKGLSESLGTFNEAFSSYLYMMKMNSLTVEWKQEPTEASFELAKRRAAEEAQAALLALQQIPSPEPEPSDIDKTSAADSTVNDTTFAANATTLMSAQSGKTGSSSTGKVKKRVGKPKLSAKEKKERSMFIEKIIQSLPLEFRGNDPTLRRHMEMVVEQLMDKSGQGVKILELVAAPDLNQARVNKCLIALVARKIVRKDNSSGQVLYHWQGLP
ncbi:hypothetical protein JAAARDRAFT_182333 [Jaapia argillacea MUCL 33604]|uniref:DASH complex subunit DAM1 n=1 Tax=Jaapia argillacea MUCL 33604 TaxID=933084 RepID=A0A067PSV5_9AGAM|nr:hypothetical protein JAAARDRAFT_182333 [Jaapia argillacea MUCL 33604]